MVERICPKCQHGNSLDNRFCGNCGNQLERDYIVPTTEQQSITQAIDPETLENLKHVGKAVAVGVATIVAEAGLTWIRRRIERMAQPTAATSTAPSVVYNVTPPAQQTVTTIPSAAPMHYGNSIVNGAVTIFSQRVTETWEQGKVTKKTVERNVWRRE